MRSHFIILASLAAVLLGCGPESENVQELKDSVVHFVDCETVEGKDFVSDRGTFFSNSSRRTDAKAFSGKHCLHLDTSNPYGLAIEFDVKPGQRILASVMNQGGGSISLQFQRNDNPVVSLNYTFLDSLSFGEWDKQHLVFIVPEDIQTVKVFCFNGDATQSYWDDLRLEIKEPLGVPQGEEELSIYIEPKEMAKLDKWKRKALKNGVIGPKQKKYVPATITYQGKKYKAKLRLKGDWLDHLKNWKISYRIKLKNGQFINGMRTFSIQDPATRWYHMEYLAHKMMADEGLLATKYDFIPVSVNGTYKGVYAIEEHFDKHLLEGNKRREAPIVRYDEQGMWNGRIAEAMESGKLLISSAPVLPFKEGRTLSDASLRQSFYGAGQLMEWQRLHKQPGNRVLNLQKYARMMAMSDMLSSRHGLIWHNMRFYYNPISADLELIGYDVYGGNLMEISPSYAHDIWTKGKWNNFESMHLAATQEREFILAYMEAYKKFCSEDYMKEFRAKHKEELKRLDDLFTHEYGMTVWWHVLEARQGRMREFLPTLTTSAEEMLKGKRVKFVDAEDKTGRDQKNVYVEGQGLQTYMMDDSTLLLYSFHHSPISIHSYRIAEGKQVVKLDKAITIPAFKGAKSKPVTLHTQGPADEVYLACGGEFECDVLPWSRPTGEHPRLALESDPKNRIAAPGETVVWKGQVKVDRLKWLPQGSKLIVEPGCNVELLPGAGLILDGEVVMNGTPEQWVKFHAKDADNHGVQFIHCPKATLENVEFKGLNTLRLEGWTLTGAVTFNECEVTLKNISVIDNHCEDALNTVRSTVDIRGVRIENSFSDAYDSDWCTGDVYDIHVDKPGNDGLDFSGSDITVHLAQIDDAGDKGISAGEASRIHVLKAIVNAGRMSLVSKDESQLVVESADVVSPDIAALVAFQKKGEFGPSIIQVDQITGPGKDSKLIEKGSILKLGGKEIAGRDEVDLDALYAPFQK